MKRSALILGLLGGLAACGGDDSSGGDTNFFDTDGDGFADSVEGTADANGNGVPAYLDPNETPTGSTASPATGTDTGSTGNGTPQGGGSGAVTPPNTGGPGQGSLDGPESDAGTPGTGGPTDPVIVQPKVACPGAESCVTTDGFVCCESWAEAGFGAPSCKAESACGNMGGGFGGSGEPDVASECDGPEDCGGGQVCCFNMQNMPNIFGSGPGLGRECTTFSTCNEGQGGLEFGFQGVMSCNTDADCNLDTTGDGTPDRMLGTCQQESADDITAAGASPRAHVKLCK